MIEDIATNEQMNSNVTLWICDTDFWLDEVNSCQNLLEEHLSEMDDLNERKQLEQFQNQIIYYRDELLPAMKHDLVQFQVLLKKNSPSVQLPNHYKELSIRITGIQQQMKERRSLINHFIQRL